MVNDIDTSGVEYFFNPRSIAVLGASTNFEKPGGRPIWALKKKGYPGKIYPVNPRYDRIDGLPCYPEIAAIPGEVDMAIISVPIDLTMGMLEECAAKNVRVAVVFTSGFAEVGPEGQALQKRMRDLARERGIRILGPNCLGLVYFKTKVMASFTDIVDLEPVHPLSLGFVTQSGAYGEKMYIKAIKEGVGFSTFVSVGNEADCDFTDFMAYLLDDPDTTVLGGYLEGAKNGAKFRRVAEKALRLGKPILLKKVGRTQAGFRAVASHTGSLAGDDQIYDAFFRQMGIIRVDELRELTSFVITHRNGRRPRGRNVGILTGSGGEGVVLADKCESFGLVVPEFTGETREKLKSYLPFFGSARNPVDMTAAVATDPSIYKKCLQAMVDDERIDMVICPGFFLAPFASIVHDTLDVCRSTAKPIVLSPVWSDESPVARELIEHVKKMNIPMLTEEVDAAQALANLAWYGEKVRQAAAVGDAGREAVPTGSWEGLLKSSEALTEGECKEILKGFGIDVTREGLAASAPEAVALARQIGYPVVMKIASPEIQHKTEVGGIRLNLGSDKEVRRAYGEIVAAAQAARPDAQIRGVLVQEMVEGGIEVIVGVTEDPVFGPAVMFGLGGVFVEALKDVSFRIAPLGRQDAAEMVREIKGFRVLQGMRGRPPADLTAIEDVILKVSRLIEAWGERIRELDINPLVVFPRGAKVVDALIVKKD